MAKIAKNWIDLDSQSDRALKAEDIPSQFGNVQAELDAGAVRVSMADTVKGLLTHKIVGGNNVTVDTVTHETNGEQIRISVANFEGGEGNPAQDNSPIFQAMPVTRYRAVTTENLGVTLTSSSHIFYRVPWTRSGTNLTIEYSGHLFTAGSRAIIYQANTIYQTALVTSVDSTSFTLPCTDTGPTSGFCAFGYGFTFEHIGAAGSVTGCVISAASQNVPAILLGVRIHLGANMRAGANYSFNLPQTNYDVGSLATNNDHVYPPQFMVRAGVDAMGPVGATISKNHEGDFSKFILGNLGAVTSNNLIMLNFT